MRTRMLTAAALVAAAIVPGFGSAATASCSGVTHSGHWDTISLPAASSYTPPPSPQDKTDNSTYPLVATSRRTGDITATDAARTGLWHSADGGCTWRSAFSLGSVTGFDGTWLTDLDYQFSSLAVADGNGAHPVVYAAAVAYAGKGQTAALAVQTASFGLGPEAATLRLFMFVSRDGGATWKQTIVDSSDADVESDALHPACMNGSVAAVNDQPSLVFVDCERRPNDGESAVYASSDSGAHWTVPAATGMPTTSYMPAAGFTTGAGSSPTLWLPGNLSASDKNAPFKAYVTAYRSRDRGASWQPVSLRAEKVCDVNTTGWVVSTATSTRRGNAITLWAPAALMASTDGGATWTRAAPFTSETTPGDYEGAVVLGASDSTTYAIGAWPSRPADWGTNFRPWNKDLRTRHVLLVLGQHGKWRTLGSVPAPANSALYEIQPGWWHGAALYGVTLTQSGSDPNGFAAKLVRYRP